VSRVVVTEGAMQGLNRCRQFLAEKNQAAAQRAGQAIERQFTLLENEPGIGRPLHELIELRELVISFGDSGYVALYRYEPQDETIFILAFRHQKEAGF
jgi:plasmid stabilization system protein ParE